MDQNGQDEARLQKARSSANNANNVSAAINVAASKGNGYAMAAAAVDKATGGKVSELGGKALTAINNHSGLQGKILQAASNKAAESGTTDRINKATAAKNSKGVDGAAKGNKGAAKSGTLDKKGKGFGSGLFGNSNKKEVEESASDNGGLNFKTSFKVVKYGLIAMVPITIIMIVMCLFTSASQIYINSVGLGQADALSTAEADKIIDRKIDNNANFDREITDKNANRSAFSYEENEFRKNKLNELNLVEIAYTTTYLQRKYSEATLEELEDFYPEVVQYAKDNDTDTVYDFFFKLYYIYNIYKEEYNVNLDLPLLMATLNVQSTDKVIVFSSNLSNEDKQKYKRSRSDFLYDKDWGSYVYTSDNSEHDIELLAQHMVSLQSTEYCVDSSGKKTKENILRDSQIGTPAISCGSGESYVTTEPKMELDDQKYREFLKEFIEKKYFSKSSNEEYSENSNTGTPSNPSNPTDYTAPNDSGDWRTWRQCGASWSNLEVGKSGKTMCKIGCLITSVSIQIKRSGTYTVKTPVDPGVAVGSFDFTSSGGLYWYSVSKLAPYFEYNGDASLVGLSKKQVANKLASYDPSKYYLILAVSRKDRDKVHHYIALDYVDTNTGELYMVDPSSNETSVYNIYKVYKVHIYKKKD